MKGMTSSVADMSFAAKGSSAEEPVLMRRIFLLLSFLALAYAFFAGLRTVSDYDLGWQMATGQWIVQHRQIPSVDVLSYTAQGEPWIYPVGAGLVFYAAYLLGGYALISWIGAAACCGTVALILRRGSAVSAGIAILAVPLIASRTTPRADMFTVVLFAAFLSLLWENYQTGRAPLWLLPLLMVAWVNLHFGFAAGLGLVLAYAGTELSETVFGAVRRRAALQRLRNALGWLVFTALATLVNPWGWGIYRALLRQERANAQQQYWIGEWFGVPLNWTVVSSSLSLRQTRGAIYLLLAIAVVAAVLALLRTQLGAAVLLLGATYPAARYVRMGAIFACVVVVVGGPVLASAMARLGARIRSARIRSLVASAAVVVFAVVALLRCFDLVTNRYYFRVTDEAIFGPGLVGWFPRRAAEFIEREKLPGEIFNTYTEGGYLTWKLGPQRRVYIDGRDTLYGVPRIQRLGELLLKGPDSPIWEQETSRYKINTIIFPLARYDGIQFVQLQDFCNSKVWRPVYLDETSAVFVRRTPQTEELLLRFPVDCATARLPAQPPDGSRGEAFNAWANAAGVLAALGRNSEALTANGNALSIFPGSSFLHWNRADLLFAMGRLDESEQEYLTAIALEPSEVTWTALARSYQKRGRIPAVIDATKQVAQFSARPYVPLLQLGYVYLGVRQPGNALKAFDDAARAAPRDISALDNGSFESAVAQGRSGAYQALGNLERAISFQEEAVRFAPDAPEPLRRLAQLYRSQGRLEDADRARKRAAKLAEKSTR
jgi:tetratricopeptide (TPR) repeat protein